MSVLDFEVNLDQSENIELEGRLTNQELKTINRIFPYESKVVAKVILRNNWKLKSKFKLTMNVPDRELQYEYIKNDDINLQEQIEIAKKTINYLPIEIMSREEIEKELERYNINFIDLDFIPEDNIIVNIK